MRSARGSISWCAGVSHRLYSPISSSLVFGYAARCVPHFVHWEHKRAFAKKNYSCKIRHTEWSEMGQLKGEQMKMCVPILVSISWHSNSRIFKSSTDGIFSPKTLKHRQVNVWRTQSRRRCLTGERKDGKSMLNRAQKE